MALRGAKIAQHGLQMGSFHLFLQPKQSKSIFGKTHFGTFVTDFWFQDNPFSRFFVTLRWPKWVAMGSKRAHFTCLCTPYGLGSLFEKHMLDPFLTYFWSQNNPFSRLFVTLEWPKWLAMGSKRAHFTCLGSPNGLEPFLEKHNFHPFLTNFLSQTNPFSRFFLAFSRAQTGDHELKARQTHLLCHLR